MKRTIYLVLVVVSSILLLMRFGSEFSNKFLSMNQHGGIKITTIPQGSVFISDKQVGTTPYQDENVKVGEYPVKVVNEKAVWQGLVRVTKGTLTVVNRELSEQVASASGEILTLAPGKGVVITSNPQQVRVEIDGKQYGQSPISITDIGPGDHTFLLSKDGYLKRNIKAFVPENYTLNLSVDLALAEANLSTVVAPTPQDIKQATVKQTPTGFLRIREQPTTNSKEIGKVNTGDSLTVLDDQGLWAKIKTEAGMEGYVSVQYIQKK
jgi:hypothetical protein